MSVSKLRFRNYRSFTDGLAELPLDRQFIGLVGVNNSGKSALLRALYELRPGLSILANATTGSSTLNQLMQGMRIGGSIVLQPGERLAPDGLDASARRK